MPIRPVGLLLIAIGTLVAGGPAAQSERHNLVLVTLDGARTQEIFGGLDLEVLRSTLTGNQRVEQQPAYRRYFADTADARRRRLMPFFWNTLMRDHGSIAGNPALRSRVALTNRHWFSYPGYAELLLGIAHDEAIKTNDPVRNPYPTVLEHLRERLRLSREQVAMFGSWSVLPFIVEHRVGALTVNSGFARFESPDAAVTRESAMQFDTPTPWDSVRHDAYTVRFARDHMARHRPQVIYVALGETDDWAHDGRYDQVLDAFSRSDRYVAELRQWLQSQPEYAGRTSLLITTDHGRGRATADWRHHGEKYPGSDETWMAFVTPRWTMRGEWEGHPPIRTAQTAATLLEWAGLDWRAFDQRAAPPVTPPP